MGEVFAGRYELADPIGRGGVGAVWRAWDHRRRRYVAAKVLQQSDAHTLLRFVREQALRIDHPHVLAPASWAADDDKVLFTMDLVAGGSLVHLVADYGPLAPHFVCILLDQLLSGLSAVHAEGVVHRDIKPANILLEHTGTGLPHLRVSDFGIAMRKGEPRLTETNYVVGTPGYFAPEQAMGAEPDFPADLFAAGLVALYLLEGAKPDARALIEHFADHGTPGAPAGIPGPLWSVLAGLLQPDPDARFRTATGARKALLDAAELLPEPGPDDELIEVFDQLGPLPFGFGPNGPAARGRRARPLGATSPTPVMPAPGWERGQGLERGLEHGIEGAGGAERERSGSDSGSRSGSQSEFGWQSEPTPQPEPGPTPEHGPSSQYQTGPESWSGSGSGSKPRPRPEAGSISAPTADPATPPRPEPTSDPSLPSMSETGSFHLPPPAPTGPSLGDRLPPPPSVPPMPAGQPTTEAPLPDPPRHRPSVTQPAPEPTPTPPPTQTPTPQPYPRHISSQDSRTPQAIPAPSPSADPAPHASTHAPHTDSPSTHPAHPVTTVVTHDEGRHSLYTAHAQEVPDGDAEMSHRGREASRRRQQPAEHRPGPPPRIAIPVLFIALICFTIGIWALTQA
ncbi:protein kinase [Streptomyces sp. NPDC016845]|uniref:serine/threonine-protein kinase n=1 Tax=Streptomyces sp. NPDC016845 TaxID=3364972 RepID=UPI0037A544EE